MQLRGEEEDHYLRQGGPSRQQQQDRSLQWSARGRVKRVFFYYFPVQPDGDDGFRWLSFLFEGGVDSLPPLRLPLW